MSGQRVLEVSDPAERENLATFLTRAVRLDPAAVVRLRRRGERFLSAWVATGFEALAVRTVVAELGVDDVTVGADLVLSGLATGSPIDLGYSMDSAWRGALPPVEGFVHVDDVPARTLVELAEQGVQLAKEHGSSHGPPASLLDQTVLTVSAADTQVKVPMRVVFALTAMDFIPHSGDKADSRRISPTEIVRVRATKTWLRIDARYGSVARRLGGAIPLTPS
jgi:branched-subunit amino acid transport protein